MVESGQEHSAAGWRVMLTRRIRRIGLAELSVTEYQDCCTWRIDTPDGAVRCGTAATLAAAKRAAEKAAGEVG